MQRWQVGSSASCRASWSFEASYVGNYGTHIQTSRNINATPLQYLSTSPVRDQATIDYLSAQRAESVLRLDAGRPPARHSAARPLRASGCCARIRSSTPSTPPPTRASPGITRCRPACRSASRRGYTLGVNYTYSRFNEATEFLNGADPAPCEGSRARTCRTGSRSAASTRFRSAVAAASARHRCRRRDAHHRRLAGPGHLHLPDRVPGRQLRQPALHRRLRRHRAVRRRPDAGPLVQHRRRASTRSRRSSSARTCARSRCASTRCGPTTSTTWTCR